MDLTLEYVVVTCPRVGCGLTFGVPIAWTARRREDHATFYCPNGHSMSYTGENDAEKAKRLTDQLTRERAAHDQTVARWRERTDSAERRLSATRGVVTRIKNRVGKGVCPCCNRTFGDLARHMAGQHPTWTPEDVEAITPPAHLNARDRAAWLAGAEAAPDDLNPFSTRTSGKRRHELWESGRAAAATT